MSIILYTVIALIFSAILHEYMHGWVAFRLGDSTARDAGRLTLNPLAHIDLFGSIILPLLLVFSNSPFFLAWAKPVPYNPYNLQDQKYGDLKVAVGGPGINFILAILFGVFARFLPVSYFLKQSLVVNYFQGNYDFLLGQMNGSFLKSLFVMLMIACFINLLLMIFNLIPIPPLDGSKVLIAFLPYDWRIKILRLEPFGIFIVLFLLVLGLFNLIYYPILFLFSLITGL